MNHINQTSPSSTTLCQKKKVNESIKPLPYNTYFNSLPNNKFFNWSKFKELAEDKINVTERLKFVLGRAENNVGKGK